MIQLTETLILFDLTLTLNNLTSIHLHEPVKNRFQIAINQHNIQMTKIITNPDHVTASTTVSL